MSFYCRHNQVVGRCTNECDFPRRVTVGYVPPPPPVRLNLDRHGLPRDYATYMWMVYKRRITDDSPARRAFLNRDDAGIPSFGIQWSMR